MIGQYKKMMENYNYINYYNNKLYTKNNLYIRTILKMSFVTPSSSPNKKKVPCPGVPRKKRKTISYSSKSLNYLKINLYKKHFSKTSKYALKLRKKIDANNRKIAMNYVKNFYKI